MFSLELFCSVVLMSSVTVLTTYETVPLAFVHASGIYDHIT